MGTVCLGVGGNLLAITTLMLYNKALKQPSFISSDLQIGWGSPMSGSGD